MLGIQGKPLELLLGLIYTVLGTTRCMHVKSVLRIAYMHKNLYPLGTMSLLLTSVLKSTTQNLSKRNLEHIKVGRWQTRFKEFVGKSQTIDNVSCLFENIPDLFRKCFWLFCEAMTFHIYLERWRQSKSCIDSSRSVPVLV